MEVLVWRNYLHILKVTFSEVVYLKTQISSQRNHDGGKIRQPKKPPSLAGMFEKETNL